MGRRPKQDTPKHEAQPSDGMRSMWELVFISQFLRVFQDKFGFAHFDLEDLENAFLEAENYPLFSIFASLLRILLKRHDIRMDSWQDVLSEELEKRDRNWNPIKDKTYSEISVENRILLLQHLIQYVCENDQSPELKDFHAEFLNPDSKKKGPIGQDSQGNIYWYFDDLRLYKEKKNKKGNKKSWETLCTTCEEWEAFIKSFEKSKDSNEKKLCQYLQNELSPKLMPLLKDHEKEKELKSKKRKSKSPKSRQKELAKEDEKDALIKQEEEEIEKMKQEEENEKQKNVEVEHRKKGRRKKAEMIQRDDTSPEQEESSKNNKEQEELEKRVAEELEKQEKMISSEDIESGLVPRTKRRCVIVREQTKKKKEWWDEEGIGSDLDEADEDADSDSSDGPRRKKKRKLIKPVELPGPTNRTYVFSTELANRAAEAVQQGRVESIIAFHRAKQTTSPYLRLEKNRTFDSSNKSYEQQKAYYSQQYRQQSMIPRGYGGMPVSMLPDGSAGPGGRPGYSPAQWQQMQLQQQYLKDRQTHQHSSQAVDDLSQIIFGSPTNGNAQPPVGDPVYSRGTYPQRMGMPGQPGVQYGYPQRMPTQQQPSTFQDSRMNDQYRPPFQQNQFSGYTQQQQQAQFFQRPRQLPQLHSPGAQSPSSDPLGANVRSPPPPYPGNRTGDSRPQQQHHIVNSPAPVPSPTSTGSPQTPLTPHTPHTPRFSGAVPSPGEPTKPPFSPSSQQSPYVGAGIFPGTKRPSSESSGSETTNEGPNRPGYIDLGNKPYQTAPPNSHRSQNPYPSFSHSSPMENNQENALRSPTDIQDQRSMAPFDNLSNESPFLTSSGHNMDRSPFSTSTASVSKSFSVESLTAPSQPAGRTGHPLGTEQQMGPYGGIYYQSKYQAPGMFGGQRFPYPSEALYNVPMQSNMYMERGSMPVYPPGRDSHL